MKDRPRPGFTIFQLLLLLAFLGFLLSLLAPYLLKLRAEAVQEEKVQNLKMIALASANYSDTNQGMMPPGNDAHNFSAGARLLPYLEQDTVYRMIDFQKSIDDEHNAAARAMALPVFQSPQDPLKAADLKWGPTNYLFNAGTKPALKDNDGVYYQDSRLRFPASFSDGTSNTIAVGETLRGDGLKSAKEMTRQHVELGKDGLKGLKPDAGTAEWKANEHIVGDRGRSWMDGRFLQGTFNGGRLPNDPRPDVDCGGLGGWSALRSLEDHVNVALADGSARPIKVKIKPEVWKALITPAGGEVLPPDF